MMEYTLEIGNQSRSKNSPTIEADLSVFTLRQLFEERYWVDAKNDSSRGRHLEKVIHIRCSYIRDRINRKPSAAAESGTRFRPYGFIIGVAFLSCSIGPFVAAEFFDLINAIRGVNGDPLTMSGVWALLTLPFAVLAFLIGGIMDAGRVVKWFDLVGRQDPQTDPGHHLPVEHQSAGAALSDIHRAGFSQR